MPTIPAAVAAGMWWIPIVGHPGRTASYVRFKRFPRKAKATAAEAIAYAARAIIWREHRDAYKRQRREAIEHPRWLEAAE